MIALSIASVSFRPPLFVVSNAFVGVDECVRAHLCDNVVRPYMEKKTLAPLCVDCHPLCSLIIWHFSRSTHTNAHFAGGKQKVMINIRQRSATAAASLLLSLAFSATSAQDCRAPVVDSIFILDGTSRVGAANFTQMKGERLDAECTL